GRVAVTKTEDAFVGTLSRNNLFETKTEILSFVSLEFDFPIFAVLLADVQNKFGFARGMKPEVKIVAHEASVDLDYSVTGLQFHLGAQATGRHLGNLNHATADIGDCRSYCKFVHNAKCPSKALSNHTERYLPPRRTSHYTNRSVGFGKPAPLAVLEDRRVQGGASRAA